MPRRPRPAEWGKLAHLYDEINESFVDYDEQVRFLLLCRERLAPEARSALDLGCGTGRHAWRLEAAGLRTVGLDRSLALLRHAHRAPEGLTARPSFVCGDLTALPLAARFDFVFAVNFVVSFLHTNEALLGALRDVRGVLSPRGLFLFDYHYYFPTTAEDRLARPWQESCRVRGQNLVVVHRPVVDWNTQLATDRMVYRFREGRQVVREVESTEVRRISLPQDLCGLLEASGFAIAAHCARWSLDDPPAGQLGVVVARRSGRRVG